MSGISTGTALLMSDGAGVAGSAMTGFGQYESGQQQKKADDYNADVTLQNTSNQVVANQQRTTALVGKQASAYAASGVDIASGSPLLIMAATAARGAQQGEQIEQAGEEQAAMQRYYGKIAAFDGTISGIGSFLNGVTKSMTEYEMASMKTPSPSGSGNVPVVPQSMFDSL